MAICGCRLVLGRLKGGQFLRHFGTATDQYDIVVVGGGIVGPATAREVLVRHPNVKLAIVEKEGSLALHQTGHNSGVIHAGIYYKPGTLKAKLCVQGLRLVYQYCDEKKIPYKKVGKLIVATNDIEVKRLEDLHQRGIANEVPDLRVLNSEKEIQQIEPHCKGVKALHSPHTGIVDYKVVAEHYVKDVQAAGGQLHLKFEVNSFKDSGDSVYPVLVGAKDGRSVKCKHVLTCGGLQSDILAQMTGCAKDPTIVPFRGEYLLLDKRLEHIVKGNIYPVPDPRFPFLGVHFTPRMDGSVWLGPNAVLAFKREGYKWSDIDVRELADTLTFPGFHKLALKHVVYGAQEMSKSAFTALQVKELQKFIPTLKVEDVSRGPAGVRAQALDKAGNLVDDFYFDKGKGPVGERVLHCRNAPSPGATSSMAIAKMIAEKLKTEFKL